MKKFAIEIKWGLIFTILSLAWMYLEKALGWHDENIAQHALYTNIFGLVAVGLYIIALLDKRKNFYNGKMNWSQGFISGIIISIVVAVLSPLAQYITHEFITPDYFENAIAFSLEQGNKREDVEALYNLNSYIVQSFFFSLTVGIVTSAAVAYFVRKK